MKKTYMQIVTKRPQLKGKAKQYGWGYRKLALVETTTREEPKMISARCKTVVRVVDCRTVYYGEGIRSEGAAYLRELKKISRT